MTKDSRTRKRRALWMAFRKVLKKPIRIYCEDEMLSEILFVLEDDHSGFFLFDSRSGKVRPLPIQKDVPHVNRITFHDGAFLIWRNGVVELTIQ